MIENEVVFRNIEYKDRICLKQIVVPGIATMKVNLEYIMSLNLSRLNDIRVRLSESMGGRSMEDISEVCCI